MIERLAGIEGTVQQLLAESLGGPVQLGAPSLLGGERSRSTVARWPLIEGPGAAPPTVIVKRSHGAGESHTSEERFLSELATTRFLNGLALDPPVSPRLYGADEESRLLVLEDLGDGITLADLLTGPDPVAAIHGLEVYAAALGRLHAATTGLEEQYAEIRRGPARAWLGTDNWETDNLPGFSDACRTLGVSLSNGFEEEARIVGRAVDHPGPFSCFNVSDACPDNHFMVGETIRLFDFEFGGFGHALMEGAYLRLPFPTCWCRARLPESIRFDAETIYRSELVRGCPAAEHDRVYSRAMLEMVAYWTIRQVSWTIKDTLAEDDPWGLASHRQRQVYQLELLAAEAQEVEYLQTIGQVASDLAARLRDRWSGEAIEMPVYPAFQNSHPV